MTTETRRTKLIRQSTVIFIPVSLGYMFDEVHNEVLSCFQTLVNNKDE